MNKKKEKIYEIKMDESPKREFHRSARQKFLELSLESTRKSYYPQLQKQLDSVKENEKHLQLLIDNLPAQISYINSKEQYVLVNQEFEKSFGLNRDQIIGFRMKEILGNPAVESNRICRRGYC